MDTGARQRQRPAVCLYRWASNLLYSELAWAYDAVSWLVSLGHWAAWRRAALAHIEGSRVLDIGFGTGELLIEMDDIGLDPFGLELSEDMHEVTTRKLRRRGAHIPRVRARAQTMPFADGSFDSAIATFPAWYVFDRATLHEVARVIGRLPIEAGCEHGRFVVVGLITGRRRRSTPDREPPQLSGTDDHILKHFRGLADEAGLDVAIISGGGGRWQAPVAVSTKRCR